MQQVKVKDLLFKVEMRDLYWRVENEERELKFPSNEDVKVCTDDKQSDCYLMHCPRHYAVVNLVDYIVYNCVTKDYKLITNEQAIQIANEASLKIFGKQTWKLSWDFASMTQSGSQCIAGFGENEVFFNSVDNDCWMPFILVANSYNSTIALTVKIGYRICDKMNAFIVLQNEDSVFKNNHNTQFETIREKFKNHLEEKSVNLEAIKEVFIRKVEKLNRIFIDKEDVLPLMLKFLNAGFSVAKDNNPDLKKWMYRYSSICKAMERYFIKTNGYYFLKVLAYVLSRYNFDSKEKKEDTYDSLLSHQSSAGKLIEDMIQSLEKGKDLRKFVGEDNYKRAEILEQEGAMGWWRKNG